MNAHLPDATSASITVSGTTAVTVSATSAIGLINEYAVVIGLIVSILSLLAGVYFKLSSSRKEALLREEDLRRAKLEAEARRQEFDALTHMVESLITRDGIDRRGDPR